jgi:CDGSH-type Zn-finger protein
MSEEKKCGCGRSQTGYCTGLHKLTNEEYTKHRLKEHQLQEQIKPELLKG